MKKKMEFDDMAGHDYELNIAKRKIEDFITKLSDDSIEFHKFAFELRKVDPSNHYSFDLLNGQVKPRALVDIICSNTWIPAQKRMKVDGNV